jgi:single-stranded DNA-specific DHH superfamily exonuclease
MSLTKKNYKDLLSELDDTGKPLIFFHDDTDGVCSFLQFYSYLQDGYGVIVKSRPIIDNKFLKKVKEYSPDKIFVLDIAMMEQDFVDEAKTPIVWLDHHPVQEIHKVKYFNPRFKHPDKNECVAYLTYKTVKKKIWIAMVGCIGDMHWPKDLIKEFRKEYPDMLPKSIKDARTALYESEIGKVAQIFNSVLKGTSNEAMKYVKALTRVQEPYEILNQTDPRGKFIYKRFKKIDREYQKILKDAIEVVTDEKLILYKYKDNKIAFSGDLANELIYKYPDKLIIIAREHGGEFKCSFRSKNIPIPPIIQKSLVDCEGYGGGHEFAAGGAIKSRDFDRFIENFKKHLE